METLKTSQVVDEIPGGIYFGADRAVTVCGANCVGREQVVMALREAGVSVEQNGCHGAIGGCAMNGVLDQGAYATLQRQTTEGIRPIEVAIQV